jgi:hypothetical protein
VGLPPQERTRPPISVEFEGETVAERMARRRRVWTPAAVREVTGSALYQRRRRDMALRLQR